MFLQTGIVAAVVLSSLFCLPGLAATKKSEKSDSARLAVEKALRAEIASRVDRRAELSAALLAYPDSSFVRWQAGFVRDSKTWQSFDEIHPGLTNSESRLHYLSRRENATNTFESQLNLADWCRKYSFIDQERAHLTAALLLAPQRDQPALLQRLKFQQVGTQWLSREQILEWQRLNRAAEDSVKMWSSKLERIAARLGGTTRQREAALAELHAVADRSAIPAIELILTGDDEDCAKAAVEALQRIDGPESSLALAKQAVFSKWPAVRATACAALKTKKRDDFVPALIPLLAIPAQGQYRSIYNAWGLPLLQSYLVAVETEDQFQVRVFNVVSQVIDMVVAKAWIPGVTAEHTVVGSPLYPRDQLRLLSDGLYTQQREQDAADDRILALNDRVISVLADVSGLDRSPDPRRWWQWWSDETDTQAAAKKPTVVVEEYDAAMPAYIPVIERVSCFTAGTPVWTEVGLTPIEKIRIGDRVLAKDIETGELAYKPVLQTTVRPPKELTALRFADEKIVCTGGHRFWSCGAGWIKARDLTSQTMLHTVTGNTPVWSAKQVESAETYNLVVADFHTYFVGKTGVLCQDLLIPHGTNCVVPGLPRK